MFAFNGKEFRFEVEDYEDLLHFNDALAALGEAEAKLRQEAAAAGKVTPEFIREYCQMVFRFFDAVLGEGAADAMFGGKMHMGICEEAYASFIEYVCRAAEEAFRADSFGGTRGSGIWNGNSSGDTTTNYSNSYTFNSHKALDYREMRRELRRMDQYQRLMVK